MGSERTYMMLEALATNVREDIERCFVDAVEIRKLKCAGLDLFISTDPSTFFTLTHSSMCSTPLF